MTNSIEHAGPLHEKNAKGRTFLYHCLKTLLAIIVFGWLIASEKLQPQKLLLFVRHPFYLLLALACIGLVVVCATLRWMVLLKGQGFQITLGDVARLTLIGMFFNSLIPGGVGGDLVKAYYAARNNPRGVEAMTTIMLDRLTGLLGLFSVAIFAIISNIAFFNAYPRMKVLAWFLGAGLSSGTVFFFVLMYVPIPERLVLRIRHFDLGGVLRRISTAIHAYQKARTAILSAWAFSVCAHCLTVLSLYLTGMILEIPHLSLRQYFFLVPIGLTINAVPVSPGGLGIGEAAFDQLFLMAGSAGGANIGLSFHLYLLFWGVPGAFFYIFGAKHRLESKNA